MIGYCLNCNETFYYDAKKRKYAKCPICGLTYFKKPNKINEKYKRIKDRSKMSKM